jgi:hypothetical protein
MANASLAGRVFRINPNSISWEYTSKIAEKPTIGGMVVQAIGAELGDLTVAGEFGVGGWEEQNSFMEFISNRAEEQAMFTTNKPFRFTYPSKGWDFLVYIKAYTQPGSFSGVVYSNDIINPSWKLTLFIVEDASPIKVGTDSAILQYLRRLSQGMGWEQTKYNGPMTPAEIPVEAKEYFGQYITDKGLDKFPQRSGGGT